MGIVNATINIVYCSKLLYGIYIIQTKKRGVSNRMHFEVISKQIKLKINKLVMNVLIFNLLYLLAVLAKSILNLLNFNKYNSKFVGFASSRLNGDLKCIYDTLTEYGDIKIFFVTELEEEIKRLERESIKAYHCRDIRKIPLFIKTKVWVTSHGPYYIPDYYICRIFKKHTGKWVDTWHGIGVEHGSGIGRAKMLNVYDIAFVSSEFYRDYYIKINSNLKEKLKITGLPRTDILFNCSISKENAIKSLELPQKGINILYAPSWGNPAVGEKKDKSLFPHGVDDHVITILSEFCNKNKCNFIIRPHPDWENHNKSYAENIIKKIQNLPGLFYYPVKKYPITEILLCAIDVLITDYSSIANDFIILNRPIIYWDKGLPEDKFIFKLEERGGFVVKTFDEMMEKLQIIVEDPIKSMREIKDNREKYVGIIYKYMDGNASDRCAKEIVRLLQ